MSCTCVIHYKNSNNKLEQLKFYFHIHDLRQNTYLSSPNTSMETFRYDRTNCIQKVIICTFILSFCSGLAQDCLDRSPSFEYKYKNNWIKLKDEVGMAVPKSRDLWDNHIHYTSLCLLFSIIIIYWCRCARSILWVFLTCTWEKMSLITDGSG